jgi:hypothetical protein
MSFNFDFSNDKPDIRELIPAGTKVLVKMTYTPGGANLKGATVKDGSLTASKEGDTKYLKAEFTVQRGPYKGRKFWSNMTVEGGKLDEKGNSVAGGITRGNIRMILDSSQGLSSKDDSPEANAKRVMPNGFRDLQGRTFACKVKIEKGKNGYPDRNGLGQILPMSELDDPAIAAPPADAPSAPVWGAPTPVPTETIAPGVIQPSSAPAAVSPGPAIGIMPTPAAPEAVESATAADAIPAWARAA